MELNEFDLFPIFRNKKFEECLSELVLIYENNKDILFDLIYLPLIKMNYLNYLYELIRNENQFQKLFEFIHKLSKIKYQEQFNTIIINHLEYIILKIPNASNSINYCINLINNIFKSIYKKSFINKSFIENKKLIKINANIINCLFNNPNLSFENKYKIYEEIIDIFNENIIKNNTFIERINNLDLLYFIQFYKNKILKEIHLNIIK